MRQDRSPAGGPTRPSAHEPAAAGAASATAPRLRLLGRAMVAEEDGDHEFEPDKSHQLLAYLAYAGDWVERAKVADLLWEGAGERQAQQNLRQLLQRLARFPWATGLEADRRRLRWRVDSDAVRLKAAIAAGETGAAAALYRGRLMVGLEGLADNEFAAWLAVEREELHGRVRLAVFEHAAAERAAGRLDSASEAIERLLDVDPLDEEALRERLTLAIEARDARSGLASYRRFAAALDRELGLEPAAATRQLAAALEGLGATTGTATGGRTGDSGPGPGRSSPTAPAGGDAGTSATATRTLAHASQGSSFVGRDLELAEVTARLTQHGVRLLSIVGPSGIGKSRLAVEAARAEAPRFPQGAALVPLAGLGSSDDVPSAIAAALGVTLSGRRPAAEELSERLASQRTLVVLDNFETVLDAAPLVSELLDAAPGVAFMVTSHVRLGLAAEWVLRLDGLSRPPGGVTASEAVAYDAVALFVQRARQLDPGFELADRELPHVLRVCELVAGSPLAIELAAAWTRVLSTAEIAEEVERNIDFMSSAAVDAPARHSSLRAAFDHSWSLLSEPEREAVARLSVLRGRFDARAAAAVAGASLATLAALSDKSLVRAHRGAFELHPLLRTYMAERLATLAGEPRRSRARHARFVLALVEDEAGHVSGPRQVEWLRRLDAHLDDLRAALAWTLEAGEASLGLRLAAPLLRFWLSRGYLEEGWSWTARVLRAAGDAEPSLELSQALNTAAGIALTRGDYDEAAQLYARSRRVGKAIGSEAAVARVALGAGLLAARRGDLRAARRHYLEGLEAQRRLGQEEAVLGLLNNLGLLALEAGDLAEATGWLEEGLALARRGQDRYMTASLMLNLAWSEALRDRLASAEPLMREAAALSRETGDVATAANALNNLAVIALKGEDVAAAYTAAGESLALRVRTNDRWGIAHSLEVYAALAVAGGDHARAARLWGAADAIRTDIGSPAQAAWLAWQEGARRQAEETLGTEAFAALRRAGAALDIEAAVALARS